MNLKVSKKKVEDSGCETLIAFVHLNESKAGKKTKSTKVVHGTKGELKSFLLGEDDVSGKSGDFTLFRGADIAGAKNILAVGLGSEKSADLEALRTLGAKLVTSLKAHRLSDGGLIFDGLAKFHSKPEMTAKSLQEGMTLGSYKFTTHKKADASTEKKAKDIAVLLNQAGKARSVQKGLEDGKTLAEAVNFARYLGDQPGNHMTPSLLAKETQAAAKGSSLKVTVWDKATIKKHKMGAFLGVAAGSTEDPRMIIMEYKGAAASKKPICFVGKGITFDSGGISLKPGAGMQEMKYDMCGGANVIGAMMAIARLKLKVNAIAFVPAAENMPSGIATKPGDIHTAMDGTTIEVNNTDAEGRLILCDALSYAQTKKPAVIVDAATLTGAMMIALGSSHTGVYTNNQKFWPKISAAADRAGEPVWQMPVTEDHSNDMKGTYADLSNLGVGREAGSATAAAFLRHFVSEDIPWAHFDIAGTAWNNGKRKAYHPQKGASGVMVRTFVELAKAY